MKLIKDWCYSFIIIDYKNVYYDNEKNKERHN